MKRTLLALCLLFSVGASAQTADPLLDHVTVLTSPDARQQVLDRARVAAALGQIVSYLRLPAEQLPNLVVIYANSQAAHIDGLPQNAKITVARITMDDSYVYQVWIAGHATDENTIRGLVWAVNRHFALHLGEARIVDVCDHVAHHMSDLVSAADLAAKHR